MKHKSAQSGYGNQDGDIIGLHQVSFFYADVPGAAINGRVDGGVLEIDFRALDCGFIRSHGGIHGA